MGDQQRWFKLWCSASDDDAIQALPPAVRWAWAAFGSYTKLHGTHGRVEITDTNAALAAQLGVPLSDLFKTLKMLPHMSLTGAEGDYGKLTVTWHNWTKYQEDSTQAERQKRSRSKKRGEENKKRSAVVDSKPEDSFGDLDHHQKQAQARELLKQVTARIGPQPTTTPDQPEPPF